MATGMYFDVMPSMSDREDAAALPPEVAAAAAKLRNKEGVVGVFWGDRYIESEGRWIAERSLCVHVQKKRLKSDLLHSELIPATIDGFRTDVLEVGRVIAHSLDVRDTLAARGPLLRTSTITAIAKDRHGILYALVSGHGALPFDKSGHIRSSYLYDGASELYEGNVALHSSDDQAWVWIDDCRCGQVLFGKLGNSGAVDFALVRLTGVEASPRHPAADDRTPLVVTTAPAENDDVAHYSRLSKRLLPGRYISVDATDFPVDFPDGTTHRYENVYVVEGINKNHFSQPGDSGSAVVKVVNNRREVIGTVLGGSTAKPWLSYVLRIRQLGQFLGKEIFGWFFTEK